MSLNWRHPFTRGTTSMIVALLSLALASDGNANDDGWPSVDHLPVQRGLPDPLIMLDGRKVTSREMWFQERKPELIRLFQHYMYGQLPPTPKAVFGDIERVDVNAYGGKATLSEITLRWSTSNIPP